MVYCRSDREVIWSIAPRPRTPKPTHTGTISRLIFCLLPFSSTDTCKELCCYCLSFCATRLPLFRGWLCHPLLITLCEKLYSVARLLETNVGRTFRLHK